MRIPLAGGSYPAIAPAAAAMTCVNLFAEKIESSAEKDKGGWILIGTPGKHLFKDLTTIDAGYTPYRGSLCVNGRLYVVAGSHFFELNSAGARVGADQTVTYDGANPLAQIFSNGPGAQIMIVTANVCHVWDGFTMNVINAPTFAGTCNTTGVSVFWVSGGKFEASQAGQPLIIHGIGFTVSSVNSPDYITLTATAAKSITAASNAFFTTLTFAAAHGYVDQGTDPPEQLVITGATGNWTPLNATWDITVLDTLNIVINLNTLTFGALTGTILSHFFNAPFQSNPAPMLSSSGAVLDGYFIVARTASARWNISPLLDGGNNGTWVWDALDSAVKESTPGNLRSILAVNKQLYLFGIDGFEVWQNTGQGVGGFPFEIINSAGFNVGSVSRWGPIDLGGRVGFLGGAAGGVSAYILDGFTPKRVSTHAEEATWNANTFGPGAISSYYLEEGHAFWQIDFGSQTWVYDLTTGIWAQRYSWSGSAFAAYNRKYHTFAENAVGSANDWGANGKHLVGGDGTGKLYEQSIGFYDDVATDMSMQVTTPYQYAEGREIYYGRQTLEMQTGSVPSGAAPLVTRTRSDDRGKTFVFPETASMGVHDDTGLSVYWPRSSASRNRLFRFQITGQNKVVLVCLDSEQTVGAV